MSDGLDQKERYLDRTLIKSRMLRLRHMPTLGRRKMKDTSRLQEERLPAFHCPKRYPRKKTRKPAEAGLA